MARRRRSLVSISAEEAHQALTFLVQEGKIAANEIQRALKNRERLIRELRDRIAKLGAEGVEIAARASKGAARQWRTAEKASRPARKRAKRSLSAATRRMYQQQGRYMAALRQLSKDSRKQIKAIREKSGVDVAIAAAKKMAS